MDIIQQDPCENENTKGFQQSIRVRINNYYYHRVWNMYGSLTFLFLIQFVIVFEIKYQELRLFRKVYKEQPNLGTHEQFTSFYWVQKSIDIIVSVIFVQMHILKLRWQKVTSEFNRHGLYYKDTQMEELIQLKIQPKLYLRNYFGVFKGVVLKVMIIMLIQPYEFLNTDELHENFESFVNYKMFMEYQSLGDFQKYFGTINDYLLYIYMTIRVYFMVKYMVSFFYMDQVKLRRVLKLYGIVNIKFSNMFKNLMKQRDVAFTVILLIISLTLFMIFIMEYETKNFNITSMPEALYFLIVSMTTVGYGDFFPLGQKGQMTMLSSIALGVVFEGMFLIAWARFIQFDSSQENAFLLICRCNLKKDMQRHAGHLLTNNRKHQLINRERVKLGKSDQYKADEVFELIKERMVNM